MTAPSTSTAKGATSTSTAPVTWAEDSKIQRRPSPNVDSGADAPDGGATHPLRMARPEERQLLQPVTVEVAHGCTTLYKHPDFDKLLALEPVEPILPLRTLVENGYAISWTGQGCRCPVMSRSEFEENQTHRRGMTSEDWTWWRNIGPDVPDDVLEMMAGFWREPNPRAAAVESAPDTRRAVAW